MNRFSLMSSTLLSASVLLVAAGAAEAQEAARNLDEIVVTAQKREERLQDVPAAVSVVQGENISAAVSSIDQLLTTVPTLNFRRGGTPLDSSLFLRGVGTINFSIAAEPSVSTVVDGVVLARAGEAFSDLFDIERIEVLRGPQGTLFGKNASAGVVNIVTQRPASEFGGSLTVSAFEESEIKARFGVDLPFSETLRARVSGFGGRYDGNIDNLFNGDPINGYNRWGVRGLVEWEATPDLLWTFAADYRHTADNGTGEIIGSQPAAGATQNAFLSLLGGVNLRGDETRQVRHNLTSQSKEEGWGLSAQADYTLGSGHLLTSITSYREWEIYGIREGDWLDRTAPYVGNAFAQLHDYGPQDSSTFTQELRLASPDESALRYVVGVYYYSADAERTFRRDTTVCSATTLAVDSTGLAPCRPGQSTFVSGFSEATFGSEFTNYAIFGDASYDVTDRFTILGGLRASKDELSVYHDRIPSLVALPGIRTDSTGFRDSTDATALTGRLGVQYDFIPEVTGYATYSRGYKGPAYNVFFNQTATQRNVIEGEDVDAVEAGLKSNLFDGRLILNAAAFRAEYTNFQANAFDTLNGVVITRLTNAGEVSTTGFELDWIARPLDDLTISGGIAYADAQIERFRAADGTLSSARKGEPIALAPELKYTLAADYQFQPGDLPFTVRLNGQYAYTSEQYSDLGRNPLLRIESFGILDAQVTFADLDDQVRVSFIGRNLTDESFASLITPGGPGGTLRYQIPREADRYFGISFQTNF
jgi:iron complex outermembrane recepter protein